MAHGWLAGIREGPSAPIYTGSYAQWGKGGRAQIVYIQVTGNDLDGTAEGTTQATGLISMAMTLQQDGVTIVILNMALQWTKTWTLPVQQYNAQVGELNAKMKVLFVHQGARGHLVVGQFSKVLY